MHGFRGHRVRFRFAWWKASVNACPRVASWRAVDVCDSSQRDQIRCPMLHRNPATPRLLTVLAIALAAALAGCGGSEREGVAAARGDLQRHDAMAAMIRLKTVLQANPDAGEARLLLGLCLRKG